MEGTFPAAPESALPGAPECGLYVEIALPADMTEAVQKLRQMFHVMNASSYERNMHIVAFRGDFAREDVRGQAGLLATLVGHNGVVALARGLSFSAREQAGGPAPGFAGDTGLEGALLDDPADIPAAREMFGEQGLVGLACGAARQNCDAAAAHEKIDFVSLSGTKTGSAPDPALILYWTALSAKPAIAEGPITNNHCRAYVEAGATFISAGDYIFGHEKGVMQGTVNMLHALDLAARDKHGSLQ